MTHSPLRYPGGKSDFLATAAQIYRGGGFEGTPVVEPYAGSAAVSLGLLDFGLTPHVTLLERDPLLFAFWTCVFERPSELIVRLQELEISVATWNAFQPLLKLDRPEKTRLLDMGVAGLFFNRANFSGILKAGPIGGKLQRSAYKIDCRTNKDDLIGRILALAMLANKVDVQFGDAVALVNKLAKASNHFFYLDPPYFDKGELLYRHFYGLKQHKQLSAALAEAEFSWLLSYDEHHVIEFLYEDFFVTKRPFRYSAYSPKNHNELLISNFPLAVKSTYSATVERREGRRDPTQTEPVDAPHHFFASAVSSV
jgi:DNA adenine methylase